MGNQDAFAVHLSGADGAPTYAVRGGGTAYDSADGVVLDGNGRIFLIGMFEGFAELGGQALTSSGERDGFVLALDPL